MQRKRKSDSRSNQNMVRHDVTSMVIDYATLAVAPEIRLLGRVRVNSQELRDGFDCCGNVYLMRLTRASMRQRTLLSMRQRTEWLSAFGDEYAKFPFQSSSLLLILSSIVCLIIESSFVSSKTFSELLNFFFYTKRFQRLDSERQCRLRASRFWYERQ